VDAGLATTAMVVATIAFFGAAAWSQDAISAPFDREPCTDGMPVSAEMRAANTAIARTFVEQGLGMGDMTAFDSYIAPDVWVSTGLKPGAPITSRDEYKQVVGSTLGAALSFQNATLDIEEVLTTVDGRVLVRFIAHADHTGEILGVPASNRRLTLSETHLFCVRDGQIVENYVGALNPLQWEMIYSDDMKKAVLP
jgi:hypothetical protein